MAIGPISWAALVHYAEYHGLDKDSTYILWIYIQEMDRAYMKHRQEEAEAKRNK